jgi:hypothetical protein
MGALRFPEIKKGGETAKINSWLGERSDLKSISILPTRHRVLSAISRLPLNVDYCAQNMAYFASFISASMAASF